MRLRAKLRSYYLTAVISLVFAVVGFSYNTWRLEVTEDNDNIRTACFEVLRELAALEQLVYAAHYDQDRIAGSPRTGWVRVGLINDMSQLISPVVEARASALKAVWQERWPRLGDSRQAADAIVAAVDAVRDEIKLALRRLR